MTLPKITGSSIFYFLLLFRSISESDDYGRVYGYNNVNGSGPQQITFDAMSMVVDRNKLRSME